MKRAVSLLSGLALSLALFSGPVLAHHKDGHQVPPGQQSGDPGVTDTNPPDKGETGGNGLGNSGSEPDDDGHGPDRDNPVDDADADGNNGNGNDSDRCDDDEGNNPQCSPTPAPSPSPEPEPEPSPSPEPEPSPTPEPSEEPSPRERTGSAVTHELPNPPLPNTGADVVGIVLTIIGLLMAAVAAFFAGAFLAAWMRERD